MLRPENIRAVVCGAYQENAYLVCPDGRGDAFIVDPGDDLPALTRALSESGRRLSAIALTHGHFDHMLAAAPLSRMTGAKVYVRPEDAEMLADPAKSCFNAEVSVLPFPEALLEDELPDEIELCGVKLKVLATPGHSAGSACLYDPEGNVLFSGDTLFCAGFGRTDLYGGSGVQLRHSLRALFALPGETRVLPGHGPETTIAAERRRYGL